MTEAKFLQAVTEGDPAAAQAALETNPLLAFVAAPDGTPATLLALSHGHKALAAAIGEVKQEKLSIFEAAALGRIRDVAVLLQLHRDRAREVSQDGYTALHLAAFFGHHYCAKLLLEERADPNAVSQNAMQVTRLPGKTKRLWRRSSRSCSTPRPIQTPPRPMVLPRFRRRNRTATRR
jgi:uncharacterized protein